MAVTVQMLFTSAVTEMYHDAFVGSAMENGTTIIQVDLRQHDFPYALGTQAKICWRTASSHVAVQELSTFHNPMTYRFIVAQGSYMHDPDQRLSFTPTIQGVSTSQHRSHSVIRLACSLAVVCGVSLRHIALLLSALFLMPLTKSSIKRWLDDIGSHLPSQEERLQPWLALTPATACHIDGDYPRGTDNGVMVVKDEQARILMTHEAASEKGDDARQCLQRLKDRGLKGTAACSDYAPSCTEAIQSVYPHARLQADHFPTVKHIWGHRKKSLLSYRRKSKAQGEAHQDEQVIERAKTLWTLRWSLLKKPANLSREEKQALATLEREEAGCGQSFRHLMRQLVHIFDHTHSEAQARIRLTQLRQDINALEDSNLEKILTFFDDHWDQAFRYLRNDVCYLFTSDIDFLPVVRVIQRLGKKVVVFGYINGLGTSSELEYVPDAFVDLSDHMRRRYQCEIPSTAQG